MFGEFRHFVLQLREDEVEFEENVRVFIQFRNVFRLPGQIRISRRFGRSSTVPRKKVTKHSPLIAEMAEKLRKKRNTRKRAIRWKRASYYTQSAEGDGRTGPFRVASALTAVAKEKTSYSK